MREKNTKKNCTEMHLKIKIKSVKKKKKWPTTKKNESEWARSRACEYDSTIYNEQKLVHQTKEKKGDKNLSMLRVWIQILILLLWHFTYSIPFIFHCLCESLCESIYICVRFMQLNIKYYAKNMHRNIQRHWII